MLIAASLLLVQFFTFSDDKLRHRTERSVNRDLGTNGVSNIDVGALGRGYFGGERVDHICWQRPGRGAWYEGAGRGHSFNTMCWGTGGRPVVVAAQSW